MIVLLLVLTSVLFLKWILIFLILPFQVVQQYCVKYQKKNILINFGRAPYVLWEKLFLNSWQRYMLFQISFIPSCHIRKWVYKILGANIGPNVVFHFKTEIRMPHKLTVGKGTIIGDNALLDARNKLFLGENVNLSSNVSIYTEQHDYRDPMFRCTRNYDKSVHIGNRVWLGSNVVILPGVTIGEGAVCCAGCVVTKDVEPYCVVAGVPAKKVNERPRNLKYVFEGSTCRLY